MRIDQSQVSQQSSYSYQVAQHFSGSYQADADAGSASNNASSKVQISDQGRQAAASDGTQNVDLSSDISSPMDMFKSLMEKMLGVSIKSMQFTGDIAEGQSGGTSLQATQNGNGYSASASVYSSSNFDLAAEGTLVTADGRTLSFSAELSMQQSEQETLGVSNMPASNKLLNIPNNAAGAGQSHNIDGKSLHALLNPPAAAATHSQRSHNGSSDHSSSGSAKDSDTNPVVLQLNDPVFKQLAVWLKDHSGTNNLSFAANQTAQTDASGQSGAQAGAASAQNGVTPASTLQDMYLKLAGAQARNAGVSFTI